MPVVNVRLSRLKSSFPDYGLSEVIEEIPYLGLDIEDIDEREDIIKIEFNPNRPDYGSENGIIRGLRGILGIELGSPRIKTIQPSDKSIFVERSLEKIRPFIYGLIARRELLLSEIELTQLISLQEDLHNGLGRKRKKASMGIHDFDKINFPLQYRLEDINRKFKPLGSEQELSLARVLKETETGKKYGHLIDGSNLVPLLTDCNDDVISFPPITNGALTKVDTNTRNLMVEVTGKNPKSAKQMLALIAYELADMGFELFHLFIHSPLEGKVLSPNLEPIIIEVEAIQINDLLGLNLPEAKIIECLNKCRCDGLVERPGVIRCIAPNYRIDLFDSCDVVEEVAIGYGIMNLKPDKPSEYLDGNKESHSIIFEKLTEILIGLGFIQIVNPSIISRNIMEKSLVLDKHSVSELIWLNDSKNSEYELLRTRLIPSMINTLSVNIHEKYPQKLFEIGKVFRANGNSAKESWYLCAAIAHDNADYSETKSNLESVLRYCFNKSVTTPRVQLPYFLDGHAAQISLDNKTIGCIGEVHPQVLENFAMRTLVGMFEIDISQIMEILNLNKQSFF
ncbi:phenylalanine--tRNA ligase subunit beta [Candidatus Nitrosocosmicus franklandus]|uniref:phenylalanine--tRNA ligase n=1 Tax=Candidatus Nitrosocosmicus franklandianus TaxID=1798806 RepID=A0A484I4V5_9ARCH|nr:phenylalanine--tRNA ligase subunit beta [Candidatus Nitrosocosmicus franklandus]VFJ12776.1 Phenylalanine--tRNA ligase beta subunit [Candidatus Nitrosocosmicus franklandus]